MLYCTYDKQQSKQFTTSNLLSYIVFVYINNKTKNQNKMINIFFIH